MIKNYLKVAIRSLVRSKGFSLLNIIGLAVGMAAALLILLWIQDEMNYEMHHEKKDRIYEAWNRRVDQGKTSAWSVTPKVLAKTLQLDFPEVEATARVFWQNQLLINYGNKKLMATGNPVDSSILQIFSFPLKMGNAATALNEPFGIVLTETLAKRIFGDENPMGKTIRVDNREDLTVTGVLKDLPGNSRFEFEFLLPWAYNRRTGNDDEYWGNNSTKTYVLLKPNTSLASMESKLNGLRKQYDSDNPEGQFFLYPLKRWRLYSNFENGVEKGSIMQFVKMFSIIAAFILLIACINFMNLSTARSEKRAKEVGIRKTVGAPKSSIIIQFLGESILITLVAGILSLIIVQLSMKGFNSLTEKQLSLPVSNLSFWAFFLGFILFTGLLAGSYPSFFLSSFQPIKVLKGTFVKSNAAVTPRKVLVVLQFSFAIIMIIATIVVHRQIQLAKDRNTGYNQERLLFHYLTGDLDKNYELVRNEMLSSGVVTNVTKTSAPMTQNWSNTWGIEWPGKDPKDRTLFDSFSADQDLAATVGLQMVQGRDFNIKSFPTDSTAILLNESAVKAMNLKNPVGQVLRDNQQNWTVIGVFKDFILNSPYEPTRPMFIKGASSWFNVIHFKLAKDVPTAKAIQTLEKIFTKYNPAFPFDYRFIDEDYATKFRTEQRSGQLAALFAGLTILISCLGLFGLAAYMAENRIKEIGIRKVLGASVAGITTLLSKDFLILVGIALVVATPIAWWLLHNWLEQFEYRMELHWWYFLIAGMMAMVIALLTVSFQAIKAALTNPVKSLRSE
ncbi:ABC transporter permease [Flavihumibacter rivuli]|uniref:ABC transporter permease n=1 Tax=Flavihumibacter rivuli TaxID=2838156 RepID=UPI001BDEF372|nr:ABC transporter permease [Flavihumibacter rivuli]ULQ57887.1 ABC transporter permease [Flavihumibacter rivuli]